MSLPSRPGHFIPMPDLGEALLVYGVGGQDPFYNRFKGESSDFLVRVTFTEALVYIGEAAHWALS